MRRRPWQREIKLERESELKALCTLIKAAEDLVIEGENSIWIDFDDRKILVSGSVDEEVAESFRAKYEGEAVLEIMESNIERGIPLNESYEYFARKFSQIAKEALEVIVRRTEETNREHAVFVTNEGLTIAIEGEEGRVIFPPSSLCAAIHTHPVKGNRKSLAHCFPSPADIRNAVSFYLDGGLLFGIACSSFVLYFQRSWIVTEENLEKLSELPDKVEKIIKKTSREPTNIFEELLRATKDLPIKLMVENLE